MYYYNIYENGLLGRRKNVDFMNEEKEKAIIRNNRQNIYKIDFFWILFFMIHKLL